MYESHEVLMEPVIATNRFGKCEIFPPFDKRKDLIPLWILFSVDWDGLCYLHVSNSLAIKIVHS